MTQKKKPLETAPWWAITDKEIRGAVEAEAALPRSPSDRRWLASLSAEEVWKRSPWWVYDHFDVLDQGKIGTGISADQLAASIARCSFPHSKKELAWSFLRPGTRNFIEVVKRQGLPAVRQIQLAFLAGDCDSGDSWWCGLCFHRYEAMEAGAQCGYRCAKEFYSVSPRSAEGYSGWLALMQSCSIVHAAILARQVREALENQQQRKKECTTLSIARGD